MALAVLALLGALPVTAAPASTRDRIQKDCADGEMTGRYSAAALRDARQNLRTEVQEYTDCQDLIDQAIASIRKPRGTSSPGRPATPLTAAPANPTEERSLAEVGRSRGLEVRVDDGATVTLETGGLAAAVARNDLPGPLRAALLLLATAMLLGSSAAIARYVLSRRQS